MAHFAFVVATTVPPSEAFHYVADMRLFAAWDPFVVRAVEVVGPSPGPHSEVNLVFAGLGPFRTLPLHVTAFDPPERMVIEGHTRFVAVHDELSVTPSPGGSQVRYSASVTLVGSLHWANRALDAAARPYGSTAAKGLRAALGGEIVAAGPTA